MKHLPRVVFLHHRGVRNRLDSSFFHRAAHGPAEIGEFTIHSYGVEARLFALDAIALQAIRVYRRNFQLSEWLPQMRLYGFLVHIGRVRLR